MKLLKCTIINLTDVSVDLCKSSPATFILKPNESCMTSISTVRSFCHGHSSIGSFLIERSYDNFYYRYWGNIKLSQKTSDEGDHVTFEILENNKYIMNVIR